MTKTSNPPSRKTTFGERLFRAIEEAGGPTKQEPAAQWLRDRYGIRISPAMLNKYKNLDSKPRVEQAARYAEALGVSIEWLYSGIPPMRPMSPLDEDEEALIKLIRDLPTADRQAVLRELIGYLKVRLGTPLAIAATAPEKRKKRNPQSPE